MSEPLTVDLKGKETSLPKKIPGWYRDFVLRDHVDEMDAAVRVYKILPGANPQRRLDALQWCRSVAYFVRNDCTGDVKVSSRSCKLRWCPMCSTSRQWFITSQVQNWVASISKPKFLTLTFQHFEIPLSEQVNNLYKSFTKLRKLKYFRDKVRGGIWFFQIKKSASDGLWHPHLHCLVDAEWLPKDHISKLWEKITLGSKIVDVKGVLNDKKVADYVARYAAKPSQLSSLDEVDQMELVGSLHGRRLCGTWGNGRSISLRPSRPPDAEDWKPVGSWSMVVRLLNDDSNARQIFNAWKKNQPLSVDINMRHIEVEVYDLPRSLRRDEPENRQMWLDFW